ncbi:putative bifunctional diguanylate cyclase/phosphodiesterase [Planomonospora parontospora]|uniref:putative bifunctional diguanylate cyclase/phosphodiesterase n=1 Tax=Planomonospora parontospora TaxID=58119 RepID=UPI00166F8204|nr:bifunctional diguanylate cyclase/phosphodiesterase [Planomonospora parontospora]
MMQSLFAAARTGSRLAGHPRAWLVFLVLGGLAAVTVPFAAGASPVVETLSWVLLPGASALAVLAGMRRNGLTGSRPWRLIGAGLLITLLASALGWGVGWVWLRSPLLLGVYQAGTLAAYGLALVALVMLSLRASGPRWAALLDAGTITVGVAMPLWTLLIGPVADRAVHIDTDLVFALALPVVDLFILGLVIRLALDSGRVPGLSLLGASYAAMFFSDVVYLLNQTSNEVYGAVSTACWLGWAVLTGAAMLHPSMAAANRTQEPAPFTRARLAAVLALALALTLVSPLVSVVVPMVTGAGPAAGAHGGSSVTLLTVLLAVLLVLRLSTVVCVSVAQAADLRVALHRQDVLQRSLSHRASHDPLTGLGNRTLLGEALHTVITSHAAAPDAPHPALLLLDLDAFKDVNDTYGHPVGDEVLTVVAQRLRELVAGERILARLGGDEFAILLPRAEPGEAMAVAQRMLETVRAPYLLDGRELYLTTSIGVLTGTAVATASDALRDADLALYAAKAAGKNQIVVFDSELRARRLHHAEIAVGLRQALAREEFTLAYQPVVDLTSGTIYAVEALLRWTPAGGRPIPPDVFIPVAEDTGLIVEIGRWVLNQACADAKRWHERYGIAVTVNVSGRQLRERAFRDTVLDVLARYALPENALTLEVTESMLLATTAAETRRIVELLAELRAHGVRIALDDFGTGYSSLAYLRTLPVDILKIDRSFTAPLTDTDPHQARAFTKAIVELSASLGLSTVVEGVESREQAAVLQQMGCPLAQGYLFSQPAPARAIDDMLQVAPSKSAA